MNITIEGAEKIQGLVVRVSETEDVGLPAEVESAATGLAHYIAGFGTYDGTAKLYATRADLTRLLCDFALAVTKQEVLRP